jgi:uncharacterized membrane protein
MGTSNSSYGFLYSGGTYTTLDVPGSTYTVAEDINNNGQIAGYYFLGPGGSGGVRGFLYDSGNYTTLGSSISTNFVAAFGINDAGEIVGQYEPIPPIPLPAALPLLATGVGALGVLGWGRKRGSHAAA